MLSVAALNSTVTDKERMTVEMEGPRCLRGGIACSRASIFDSPEERRVDDEEEECGPSSSTTSSIGRNSDLSSNCEECEEENEVQSKYKGSLDSVGALEEALPVRKGMSKFYTGKSKSFTSLAAASSAYSMKDIAKPENGYTRKRRNLLAFSHGWEKCRNFNSRGNCGGISKRPLSSSRGTLALAVAMSSSESNSSTSDDKSWNSKSPPHLPPLHPRSKAHCNSLTPFSSPQLHCSPRRSFSLVNLQQCPTTASVELYRDKTGH